MEIFSHTLSSIGTCWIAGAWNLKHHSSEISF